MSVTNTFIRFFFPSILFLSFSLHAGVIIGGTRVIYQEGKKEASMSVSNGDNSAYLIQSWIEHDNQSMGKPPFIITPPLFRLDGGEKNNIRIISIGSTLPNDRESLFWLNIKSIPQQSKKDNVLQIAIANRMKLIYRPSYLQDTNARDTFRSLIWKSSNGKIKVYNPTGYYMNFNSIKINGIDINDVTYVKPKSIKEYSLPKKVDSGTVSWTVIDDYGAITESASATF